MRTNKIIPFLALGGLSLCSAFLFQDSRLTAPSTLPCRASEGRDSETPQTVDIGSESYHRRQRSKEITAYQDMMVGLRHGRLRRAKKPGTLILVRHGHSEGTQDGRFIGWADPALTSQGLREAQHAARLLRESGYDIDVVFTSHLNRAIHSTWAILRELDETYLPVFKSWRLNERHYGALTGLGKAEVASRFGVSRVQTWRTDPNVVPPPMSEDDKEWPGKRRKFANIENLPASESLVDCAKRLEPLWQDKILSELEVGHNVLVVGHGSTLRSIIKFIQGISDEEACKLKVPPGSPLVYEFDRSFRVIPSTDELSLQEGISGKL